MNVLTATQHLVDHAISIQLALFASIMISMWVLEKTVLRQSALVKWRHTSMNGLFIVSALPIQIPMTVFCMGLANWAELHHWGLVHLLPNADSPWIKYGLMFVALDFLDWVYHVTMHRVGAFWRFHLVHHTDREVDVSTTVREHPGETLVRNGFLILWTFLCGASVEVLILRQTVETAANILAHTKFRLSAGPERIVNWLFITPNLHHAHHHFKLPATNCNYGDVFSIWDRLFGTFKELPREDTVFGLDTHMDRTATFIPFPLPIFGRSVTLLRSMWFASPRSSEGRSTAPNNSKDGDGHARISRRLLLPLSMIAVFLAPGSRAAAEPSDPAIVIQALGDEALRILTAPDANPAQRKAQIAHLFREAFDLPGIGRFVLGRYWRMSTPVEQQQYLDVFGTYIIAIYAGRFSKYSGEKFVIVSSRQDSADSATVLTRIVPANGNPPIRLDWKLANGPNGYKITDVVAENLSLAMTKRDEFASIIDGHGGSIQPLIDLLKQKTED